MDNDISFEIQTILNPSKEPFDIIYNNQLFRTIPAGKAVRLPKKPFGMLAEKHLIDRMCNIEKVSTGDPLARDKWRKVIVIDENTDPTLDSADRNQVLQRKLDLLNHTNDSSDIKTCDKCGVKTLNIQEHIMLNHAQVDAAEKEQEVIHPENVNTENIEVVEGKPEGVSDGIEFSNQKTNSSNPIIEAALSSKKEGANVLKEEVVEEEKTEASETSSTPTREELIAYARDTLKMNTEDPKTKQILEEKSIDDLVKELSYGI